MADQIDGSVERVTYHDEESGYTVLRLAVPGRFDLVTVVGILPDVQPGERLRLEGVWTTHPQYGRQFKAERCEQVLPATAEGIRRYLGSGLVRGVGPVTAAHIVEHFGADALRVLDEEPRRLREVPGVGPRRVAAITRAWEEQRQIRQVMLFLQSHGVATGLAVKIYKTYGDDALQVVQSDPYRLARDIWGVGFKTADKIARDLGLPPDSPSRIQAGVAHVLGQMADDGHVYAPQDELVVEAARLLEVDAALVPPAIESLDADGVVRRETLVYPVVGRASRPPRQQEEGVGRASHPPRQQEEGVRASRPPCQQEEGVRASRPPCQQEEGVRASHPPRQQEEGVGRASRPPRQQEEGVGRASRPPCQQEEGVGRASRPPRQQEEDVGQASRPPRPPHTEAASIREQPAAYVAAPALREERAVYLAPFYVGEVGAAGRLRALVESPRTRLGRFQRADWDALLAQVARDAAIELSAEQRQAVRAALTHKVTVLTGGPGTGKTVTVRTVIAALETLDGTYALCAPTGRAAKRLSEATDRPAQTVHRLLEYSPQEGFRRNEHNPLPVDLLIVDEASMLDLLLAHHLLKAVDPAAHLLLVGDVDQLPSVGAGDVLRDVIACGRARVIRLTHIFRQAAQSGIVVNAHRIHQGQMPILNEFDDFFFFAREEPQEATDLLVDIVARRIPQKFGLDPLDDIQVLAPMYRGPCGVSNLNERLQEALNPPAANRPERRLAGRTFRVGDRVMQIVNNYAPGKEVYNGDIGRVVALDGVAQTLTVRMDERRVVYDWSESDELVHAYAVSVHKSQGAEYPAVVVPLLTQHYMMLQRNLLYTAVTRAKRLVVLVGTRRAIGIAVHNDRVRERRSGLRVRLA